MTKRSNCPIFAQAVCPRLRLVSMILCLVIVVGSSSHSTVAVLPTDNPNITVVWFMD